MKIHPGWGYPSALVAKVIAICDLIFAMIGVFWFVWILEGYNLLLTDDPLVSALSGNDDTTTPPEVSGNVISLKNTTSTEHPREHLQPLFSVTPKGIMLNEKTWNVVLSGFYTSMNLLAFLLLLSASNDKNICKLWTWFGIRASIFTFKCFLYITYLIVGLPLHDHIPHIIFMGIHLYGLWVVWVFIEEIKEERRTNSTVNFNNQEIYRGGEKEKDTNGP